MRVLVVFLLALTSCSVNVQVTTVDVVTVEAKDTNVELKP